MFVESNKQEFRFRTVKRNKREMSVCTRVVFGTVLMTAVATAPVLAAPTGGSVQRGSASITTGTNTVIDQMSPRVDITWTGFNTTNAESVHFNQQHGSASVAVNRISGGHTNFDGMLTAPGHVYLINPDGMTFGATAQINVGAFLATTSNPDVSGPNGLNSFVGDGPEGMGTGMALHFSGDGERFATITNNGTIIVNGGFALPEDPDQRADAGVGGFAVLAAAQVVNNGTVQANYGLDVDAEEFREGHVELASTQDFTLNKDVRGGGGDDGLPRLVEFDGVPETAQTETPLEVTNTGTLRSRSGNVYVRANMINEQLMQATVNLDGVIDADTISFRNGGKILVTSATDIKFDDLNDDGVGADIHARHGSQGVAANKVVAKFVAADDIVSVEGTAINIDLQAEGQPGHEKGSTPDARAKLEMLAGADMGETPNDGGNIDITGTINVSADIVLETDSAAVAKATADFIAENDVTLNTDITVSANVPNNIGTSSADFAQANAELHVQAGNTNVNGEDPVEDPNWGTGHLVLNGDVSLTATANHSGPGIPKDDDEASAKAVARADLDAANSVTVTTGDQTINVSASANATESDDARARASLVVGTHNGYSMGGGQDNSIEVTGPINVGATANAADEGNARADLLFTTDGSNEVPVDASVTVHDSPTVTANATGGGSYSQAKANLIVATRGVGESEDGVAVDASVTMAGPTVSAMTTALNPEVGDAHAYATFDIWSIEARGYGSGDVNGSVAVNGDSLVTAMANGGDFANAYADYEFGGGADIGEYISDRLAGRDGGIYVNPVGNSDSWGNVNASIALTGNTTVDATAKITDSETMDAEGMAANACFGLGYSCGYSYANSIIHGGGAQTDGSVSIVGNTDVSAQTLTDFGTDQVGDVGWTSAYAYIWFWERQVIGDAGGMVDGSLSITGDTNVSAANMVLGNVGYSQAQAIRYLRPTAMIVADDEATGPQGVDASLTINGNSTATATNMISGDGAEHVGTYAGLYNGGSYVQRSGGVNIEVPIDASTTITGSSTSTARNEVGGSIGELYYGGAYTQAWTSFMDYGQVAQYGAGDVDMSLNVDGPAQAGAYTTVAGDANYVTDGAEVTTGGNRVYAQNGAVDQSVNLGPIDAMADVQVGGDLTEGYGGAFVNLAYMNYVESTGGAFDVEPGATVVDASLTTTGPVNAIATADVGGDVLNDDTLRVRATIREGGEGSAFWATHADSTVDGSINIGGDQVARAEGSASTGPVDAVSEIQVGQRYVAHYGGGFVDATINVAGNNSSIAMTEVRDGIGSAEAYANTDIGLNETIADGGETNGAVDDSITVAGTTTVRAQSNVGPVPEGGGEQPKQLDELGAEAYAGAELVIGAESDEETDGLESRTVTVGGVTVEALADNQSGLPVWDGSEGPGASAYTEAYIFNTGDVLLTGPVLSRADANAVDTGALGYGAQASSFFSATAGREALMPWNLTVTGSTIDVLADATVSEGAGSSAYSFADAMAGAALAASGDVNIGLAESYTDINVDANAASANGVEDRSEATAALVVLAGSDWTPNAEDLFESDFEDLFDLDLRFQRADLNYFGDITVQADADAAELPYGGAYAFADSLALLGAGDDVNIITDPVTVLANADIAADPEAVFSSGGAESSATLVVGAGLAGPDDSEDVGNIYILGDVATMAHANHPQAEPPEGSAWELAFATTVLLPELVDAEEAFVAVGSLTIEGQEPLAHADTDPVPTDNLAQVQQSSSAYQVCEDGECSAVEPLPADPVSALDEILYVLDEEVSWENNLSFAALVLAGDPIDIHPDPGKSEVTLPAIVDRTVDNNPPNPAFPGSRGLSFDGTGNMVPADSLAEGNAPATPPGIGDNTPLLTGDPTALFAPTAAGPGQGEEPDFCNQLVNGACEQGAGGGEQL